MKALNDPVTNPFNEIEHVAIGIGEIDHTQRHMGLFYRTDDGIAWLHLEWHHKLTNEAPETSFFWIAPHIHSARARQVAAICRLVWKTNGKHIPYAFSYPNDCFGP